MYITIWFIFKLPIFPIFCISSRLRKNDFMGKLRQTHNESWCDIHCDVHYSTRNLTLIPNLKSKHIFANAFKRKSCLKKFAWASEQRTKIWARTVHFMDWFGRRTMVIFYRWTELDCGRTRTVNLMDRSGRRTIKILKSWTEVDEWTDGWKSVRGGLGYTVNYVNISLILWIFQ